MFLDHVRALPFGTIEDITAGEPFVVLSPHPDDETLGAGGLIAAACARRQQVDVVLVTDGTRSHPNSRAYPPERLADLRNAEMKQACHALGVPARALTCLGLVDTHAPVEGASFETAVSRVDDVVEAAGAWSVFVTWKHDPHCDHEAAAQMALALRRRRPGLRLWSYPIWGWHLPAGKVIDAPPPTGYRFDIAPWQDRKRAAIAAHQSQMTALIDDDPHGFCFTPETLAPFLQGCEYFFEVPL